MFRIGRPMFKVFSQGRANQHELFHDITKKLLPVLSDYVKKSESGDRKVVEYLRPEELKQAMEFSLPAEGTRDTDKLIRDISKTLQYSVCTSHPLFLDKLYGGSDVVGQVAEWIAAILNTNVHTYAVAPVFAVMEVELLKEMRKLVGFQSGDGVFCPGGSFANLMAMVAARDSHPATSNIREKGMYNISRQPIIFASTHSHYSVKRGAMVLGMGLDNIEWVETDSHGRMLSCHLRERVEYHEKSQKSVPFFLHATGGTTVTGSFDYFNELADIASEYNLHFHVDAAWGGSVVMSDAHKHLMQGAERADSLTWNPHKMMGIPLQCSALLVKDEFLLRRSNALNAEYLFHSHADNEFDLGDKTLQCGRKSDSFKLWLSWQFHGKDGFADRINHAFNTAKYFTTLIESDARYMNMFKLVQEPQSLNVCFWYVNSRDVNNNRTSANIYERLQKRGFALVNFNPFPDKALPAFFRVIFNNNNISKQSCHDVLDEIIASAEEIPL